MPQDFASSFHQLRKLHIRFAALLVSGIILVGGHDAALAQTIDQKLHRRHIVGSRTSFLASGDPSR